MSIAEVFEDLEFELLPTLLLSASELQAVIDDFTVDPSSDDEFQLLATRVRELEAIVATLRDSPRWSW